MALYEQNTEHLYLLFDQYQNMYFWICLSHYLLILLCVKKYPLYMDYGNWQAILETAT